MTLPSTSPSLPLGSEGASRGFGNAFDAVCHAVPSLSLNAWNELPLAPHPMAQTYLMVPNLDPQI